VGRQGAKGDCPLISWVCERPLAALRVEPLTSQAVEGFSPATASAAATQRSGLGKCCLLRRLTQADRVIALGQQSRQSLKENQAARATRVTECASRFDLWVSEMPRHTAVVFRLACQQKLPHRVQASAGAAHTRAPSVQTLGLIRFDGQVACVDYAA
jgi:hypothetical protein